MRMGMSVLRTSDGIRALLHWAGVKLKRSNMGYCVSLQQCPVTQLSAWSNLVDTWSTSLPPKFASKADPKIVGPILARVKPWAQVCWWLFRVIKRRDAVLKVKSHKTFPDLTVSSGNVSSDVFVNDKR